MLFSRVEVEAKSNKNGCFWEVGIKSGKGEGQGTAIFHKVYHCVTFRECGQLKFKK